MEIHRLKPMEGGYPTEVFNKLYAETQALRESLARQLNPKAFGVTSDIILSWFDDKFMHAFYKYYHKHEDMKDDYNNLKGYVINALQMFKYRALRKPYQGGVHQYQVEIDAEIDLLNIIKDENDLDDRDVFLGIALDFLKKKLCDDAYTILQVELNPPPYILSRVKNPNARIPSVLIAEFLLGKEGLSTAAVSWVSSIRRDIKEAILEARLALA